MNTLQNIIGDYEQFLKDILQEVQGVGFDLGDFVQLDHLCYRVATIEAYKRKKAELQTTATLLSEVLINGRPIATFHLGEPIRYDGWRVDTIELPAPKEGHPVTEGLEHIEFVLYDGIPAFLKKYAGKPFDLRAVDRGANPEVKLKLNDKHSVNFHLLSLPAAVYLEEKLGLTDIKDNVTEGVRQSSAA